VSTLQGVEVSRVEDNGCCFSSGIPALVGLLLRLQEDLLHLLLYGINVTVHWLLALQHIQRVF
jgi:hypothetical protein